MSVISRFAKHCLLLVVVAGSLLGCPPINQSQLTLFGSDPELVGTWLGTISAPSTGLSNTVRLLITETTITLVETTSDGSIVTVSGDYGVDTSQNPHWIDFARRSNSANTPPHNNLARGVYEIDGDALSWASTTDPNLPRPSTVNSSIAIIEVVRENLKNGSYSQPSHTVGFL